MTSTFAAALTPPGRGAIATIAVYGESAAELLRSRFQRVSVSADWNAFPIAFGTWSHACGSQEELVVVRTAVDAFEIHCHGGDAAVDSVLRTLSEGGVEIVDWTEFVWRTEVDPLAAEARIALALAKTAKTTGVLLDQLRGSLRASLISIAEDLVRGDTAHANSAIVELLQRAELGRHLTAPWKVVFAGHPNVGKSSLINALMGFERSIVDALPGTTRDVVTAATSIGGWPVELSDTAGIRATNDLIEQQGVARAKRELAMADLVVLVSADDLEPPPVSARRLLRVWNKADLGATSRDTAGAWLRTSAKTGEGLVELMIAMEHALVPAMPPTGAAVPFTPRQTEGLERAGDLVRAGQLALARAAIQALL